MRGHGNAVLGDAAPVHATIGWVPRKPFTPFVLALPARHLCC